MNRELKDTKLKKESREKWIIYARLKCAIAEGLPNRDYKIQVFRDLHRELYGASPDLHTIFGDNV
jgi:hypothetical protein